MSIFRSTPSGSSNFDRMRIAQGERRDLALHVGAVADADDVQFAREPARDALHGIRGQRARQPVERRLLVGGALHFQLAVGLLEA